MRKFTRRALIPVTIGFATIGTIAMAQYLTEANISVHGETGASQEIQVRHASVDHEVWPGACEDVTIVLYNPNEQPVQATHSDSNTSSKFEDGNANSNRLVQNTMNLNPLFNPDNPDSIRIPAKGEKTIHVQDFVCLSPLATTPEDGKDFNLGIKFLFDVIPASEYSNAGFGS